MDSADSDEGSGAPDTAPTPSRSLVRVRSMSIKGMGRKPLNGCVLLLLSIPPSWFRTREGVAFAEIVCYLNPYFAGSQLEPFVYGDWQGCFMIVCLCVNATLGSAVSSMVSRRRKRCDSLKSTMPTPSDASSRSKTRMARIPFLPIKGTLCHRVSESIE